MQNQPQKITIEVIESKSFRVTARGYDQHEVDEFLDSICDELERQEAEMAALRHELAVEKQRSLDTPVVPAPAMPEQLAQPEQSKESTVLEIIEIAQRVQAQTIADAQAKAEKIIEDARNEVKARLGLLGEEREQVAAEVERLRAAAKAYKEQVAALVARTQELLDASEL